MRLDKLAPVPGSRKKEKRIGRGPGSGHGKTSTKGHKGQKARSGGVKGPGFEGGQQPLIRRIPKRGFKSLSRKEYSIVNLKSLDGCGEKMINPEILKHLGLIKHTSLVKILGAGDISKALTVHAHKFSKTAEEKIKQAGGSINII
ncbi:MAG: 50S ribosomal protein L15 [Nitrospirae bacterium]|nr:50S ribosomal protein L15 [Nitrospirota bacterium]MBI3605689.1 50S ribosomal protein L15 [Nitrospirota bacterium]